MLAFEIPLYVLVTEGAEASFLIRPGRGIVNTSSPSWHEPAFHHSFMDLVLAFVIRGTKARLSGYRDVRTVGGPLG